MSSTANNAVAVSWDQQAAFRRFTQEFASWWPWSTHSIGGKRASIARAGGEIASAPTETTG